MELSSILRRIMEERRLSQRDLERQTGLPKSTLSDWLSGAQPRNLDDVRRLSRHLGVPFEYLLFGKTDHTVSIENLPSELLFEGYLKVKIERVIKKEEPDS